MINEQEPNPEENNVIYYRKDEDRVGRVEGVPITRAEYDVHQRRLERDKQAMLLHLREGEVEEKEV